MARIYDSLLQLVGRTPMVRANNLARVLNLKAELVLKLESYNPLRSVKDRPALAMIESAEHSGVLTKGSTIIEASSGNMGIGIAFAGRLKGYRTIIVMPESMSVERRAIITALGAELVLSPASAGMHGALAEVERLLQEIPGSVSLGQFDHAANPGIHTLTTAQEIWEDTDGQVDVFVAGVGTGGTVSGVARGLRPLNPDIRVVAVQPADSPVLTGGSHTPHMIQGIGAGFVPQNYDASLVDEVLSVSNDQAIDMARLLARTEGILGGFSGGAALWAGVELAKRSEMVGKRIVILLPDTGERYLSTTLFT